MDNNAVSIAALGLAATMGAGVLWLAKYFAKELSATIKENTKASVQQAVASQKAGVASDKAALASHRQEQASAEVLTFMRALNGKLAKATIQTVQEQTVEHQTVNHSHIDENNKKGK